MTTTDPHADSPTHEGETTPPICPLMVSRETPAWMVVEKLLARFGYKNISYHLRDELVNWLAWAQYGEDIARRPAPVDAVEPVASIVPNGCTGSSLAFAEGVLYVSKDGSGYIAVNEEHFELEDDRCEGPDGPEGSVHWITRFPPGEMQALRDFLNGARFEEAASTLAALRRERDEALKKRDFEQSSRLTSEAQLSTVISNLEARATAAEAENAKLQAENERLREFAASFHITVVDNFYKDVSLSLHRPHSLLIRVPCGSDKSWIFADLEMRRRSALTPRQPGEAKEGSE